MTVSSLHRRCGARRRRVASSVGLLLEPATDSEVGDLHERPRGLVAREQDVAGLQIAMNDALRVKGLDALEHLAGARRGSRRTSCPSSQSASERPCTSSMTRYAYPASATSASTIDTTLGWCTLRRDLGFARESREREPAHFEGHLERQALAVAEALHLVHGAHAARAERADDAIARLDHVAGNALEVSAARAAGQRAVRMSADRRPICLRSSSLSEAISP